MFKKNDLPQPPYINSLHRGMPYNMKWRPPAHIVEIHLPSISLSIQIAVPLFAWWHQCYPFQEIGTHLWYLMVCSLMIAHPYSLAFITNQHSDSTPPATKMRFWTYQILVISTSSTLLAPLHSIRPCLYMLAMTPRHLLKAMSVSRSFTDWFCSEFIAFPQFFHYMFSFLSSICQKFHQEFQHEVLVWRYLDFDEMWLMFTSIYILKSHDIMNQSSFREWCVISFNEIWTRQIVHYAAPTIFSNSFCFCYLLRSTNHQYTVSFSNPSIWRATLSFPFRDADTCGWNSLPKKSCFVDSSLRLLWEKFPIHRHIHTLYTRKPCYHALVFEWSEIWQTSLCICSSQLWRVLPCYEEQYCCPDAIFWILESGQLWNYSFRVHQRQLIQIKPIFHKIINQFIFAVHTCYEVHQ